MTVLPGGRIAGGGTGKLLILARMRAQNIFGRVCPLYLSWLHIAPSVP